MSGIQGMWVVGGVRVGRAWEGGDIGFACLDHERGSPIAAAATPVAADAEVRRELAYPPIGRLAHPVVTDETERAEAIDAYHAALRLRDTVASGLCGDAAVTAAGARWRWRTHWPTTETARGGASYAEGAITV